MGMQGGERSTTVPVLVVGTLCLYSPQRFPLYFWTNPLHEGLRFCSTHCFSLSPASHPVPPPTKEESGTRREVP